MRTMRYHDLSRSGSNTWRVLDGLVGQGALIRLAMGVYTAPPDGHDGHTWKPDLETAGLAIATARHGNRNAILMGLGAARHWGTLPRAVATTVVAVDSSGHRPVNIFAGDVHFVARRLDRIDAVLEPTELGRALVTTPAQTLFDLLMRPHQGNDPAAAAEAVRSLFPVVHSAEFNEIIAATTRINTAVREAAHTLGARS